MYLLQVWFTARPAKLIGSPDYTLILPGPCYRLVTATLRFRDILELRMPTASSEASAKGEIPHDE
jgi:hypothetical protein